MASMFKHSYDCGTRKFYEAVIPWHEYEERIVVEFTPCEIYYDKWGLGSLWKKRSDFDATLTKYWGVNIYFYAVNGQCWSAFNPTVYHMPGRDVIRFEWMLDATEDNITVLLDEIQRMYEQNIVRVDVPSDYFDRAA